MAGATSLVELILKKWGDDAAGAAKELEEKVGFPESVANRIATGELPMDAESVARRADEQGYDTSSLLYHGTEESVTDFSPSAGGELGGGVYVTKDPTQASEYARKQYGGPYRDGANVMPVYSKPLKQTERGDWVKSRSENMNRLKKENNGEWEARFAREAEREIADDVSAEGYGGIYLNNPGGERSLMYDQGVIYDPNNIRSPNAAFDPEYTGPNIMGGAAGTAGLAGLLAAGQSEDADAGFVTRGGKTLLEAFHGSPHKFDKFSMDQIGTGEGAQAYGHGLYFADSEDVARGYQETLSSRVDGGFPARRLTLDGIEIDPKDEELHALAEHVKISGKDEAREVWGSDPLWQKIENAEIGQVYDGALYRTEIEVTPESLLDWDKPLSEQSDVALQAFDISRDDLVKLDSLSAQLREIGTENVGSPEWDAVQSQIAAMREANPALASTTGQELYRNLTEAGRMYEGPIKGSGDASGLLSDRGIKGIKYLDGDSRAVGDGTSNYVIFDDSLINIAERGNADPRLLAGTAAGTAGLLAAGQSEDADAGVTLRLLKEAPEAYNALRKQIARGRQNGLSPQRVAEKFIHDQSMTNYDKGFNQYAYKVDGASSGEYWKEGVQGLYDEILGAVDEPDPMVVEAMDSWLESHLGRETGSTMAQNRAKARAARAASGGAAAAVAGGANAQESLLDAPVDPTAPLPAPTWGEAFGKVGDNMMTALDAPLSGIQGLTRTGYGLLTGEGFDEAMNNGADVVRGGPEEGADRLGKWVTEKTGDETLGFYAKWGSLLGSPF